PRALHSFPTRRSSDLVGTRSAGAPGTWNRTWPPRAGRRSRLCAASSAVALGRPPHLERSSFRLDTASRPPPFTSCVVLLRARARSEEHTSELQSRFDL